jgi:hypothetical protein
MMRGLRWFSDCMLAVLSGGLRMPNGTCHPALRAARDITSHIYPIPKQLHIWIFIMERIQQLQQHLKSYASGY